MAKLFDRVGQATATTGTGTITLGAVITDATNGDLITFQDAGAVAGDSVSYLVVDGNNTEEGTSTLGGTGPGFTMTRTVARSKISGVVGTTALTLSGNAKVYSVPSMLMPGNFRFGTSYFYGADTYDATNYSRLKVTHAGGTSGATVATEAGGTGTAGPLTLQPGTGNLRLGNAVAGTNIDFYDNQFGFSMALMNSAKLQLNVNLDLGGAVLFNAAIINAGINSGTGAYFLGLAGSTTSKAAIHFVSGVAPTTPNDGDMWFDGTNLKMRVGGVTKTVTLT